MSKEEPWYVYIIECSDKTLYTGISNNVSKRVLKHNSGKGAKYTRNKLPVALKWFKECNNKSEAAKEEYRIKKLTRGNKLELIKEFTV
jgi:putative endonuclease